MVFDWIRRALGSLEPSNEEKIPTGLRGGEEIFLEALQNKCKDAEYLFDKIYYKGYGTRKNIKAFLNDIIVIQNFALKLLKIHKEKDIKSSSFRFINSAASNIIKEITLILKNMDLKKTNSILDVQFTLKEPHVADSKILNLRVQLKTIENNFDDINSVIRSLIVHEQEDDHIEESEEEIIIQAIHDQHDKICTELCFKNTIWWNLSYPRPLKPEDVAKDYLTKNILDQADLIISLEYLKIIEKLAQKASKLGQYANNYKSILLAAEELIKIIKNLLEKMKKKSITYIDLTGEKRRDKFNYPELDMLFLEIAKIKIEIINVKSGLKMKK